MSTGCHEPKVWSRTQEGCRRPDTTPEHSGTQAIVSGQTTQKTHVDGWAGGLGPERGEMGGDLQATAAVS